MLAGPRPLYACGQFRRENRYRHKQNRKYIKMQEFREEEIEENI